MERERRGRTGRVGGRGECERGAERERRERDRVRGRERSKKKESRDPPPLPFHRVPPCVTLHEQLRFCKNQNCSPQTFEKKPLSASCLFSHLFRAAFNLDQPVILAVINSRGRGTRR